jgi:hypothetical protein
VSTPTADSDRDSPLARPERGTISALKFVTAQQADVELLGFVVDTVLRADYVAQVARRALDGADLDKDLTPRALARSSPGPTTRTLRDKRQALLEMLLARSVDNYLRYVVDMIREVLRKQPNLLRSKQHTLTLEEILDHGSIDDLVHFIIEAKVNSLSYEGFERIRAWCTERGIPLTVAGDADYARVVEFISTRNLIAHSRCRIDERYVRTVGSSAGSVGDLRKISADDYFDCVRVLSSSVSLTDAAATTKFGLDVVEIPAVRGRVDDRSQAADSE